MATPFGKDTVRQAKKDFHIFGNRANAFTFGLSAHPDNFGILKQEINGDTVVESRGKVKWNWAYLSTLGSCACWGVTGDDRQDVFIRPNEARLYQMMPHNVDIARQILSHILGLGALTYRAAQYEGQEDILADAEWTETREYPKPTY